MKAHRKGKIEDLVKAERKRESELVKLNREYSPEQLKRQRSFEKEDKERKKGHKAVWLLVQTISQVPTLRSWVAYIVKIDWCFSQGSMKKGAQIIMQMIMRVSTLFAFLCNF